jgi:hypothetical protein
MKEARDRCDLRPYMGSLAVEAWDIEQLLLHFQNVE